MNGPIPEKYVEFCRAVARMARDAGIDRVGLTIHPGFEDRRSGGGWGDPIQMNWEMGRHGDDSRNMAITSTVLVRAALSSEGGSPSPSMVGREGEA